MTRWHIGIISVGIVLVLLAAVWNRRIAGPGDKEATQMESNKTDSSAFCLLSPEELAERVNGYTQQLSQKVQGTSEFDSGVRFDFAYSPETLNNLLMLVRQEAQCCSMMAYDLRVSPSDQTLSLEVSGPPEVKPFVRSMLGGSDSTQSEQ